MINVCERARQTCTIFHGEHASLHWGLDDTAAVEGNDEEKLDAFERTVMEVNVRLRPFVEVAGERARGRAGLTSGPATGRRVAPGPVGSRSTPNGREASGRRRL